MVQPYCLAWTTNPPYAAADRERLGAGLAARLRKSFGSESRMIFFHAEPTCLGSEPDV